MAISSKLKRLDSGLSGEIQGIANKENATIISFVAPQAVRTSPVTFAHASIEESEIYRLAGFVTQAEERKATDHLHFVIHTPGGSAFASFRIATFLRSKFKKISAFIPYQAASGGTILCCAADAVYIGDFGNLTSIDPQVYYKQQWVSCHAFLRVVDAIEDQHGEKRPGEVLTPWQQMTDKLDPVIHDEMSTLLFTVQACAIKLLRAAGYGKVRARDVAWTLAQNFYSHDYPLFSDEVAEIGFNVQEAPDIMTSYAKLVLSRSQENHPRHVIDAFYPANGPAEEKDEEAGVGERS